ITESGTPGLVVRSLGEHDVAGLSQPQPVHQLVVEGLPATFPPLLIGHLPPLLPIGGEAVAGYELREEIGAGAFGLVHRAYQPSVGREVAVKVIRPEFANDVDFIRRFEVEAQLVARLEHPHIVPLHDYWREPDGAFLVMRLLQAGSLEDRLAAGPLSMEEASAVLATIGPALAYAHRHGVAHRDLKASNVLFDADGVAYLTDFGIARPVVPGEDPVVTDVRDLRRLIDGALGREAGLGNGHGDVASLLATWEQIAHGDVGAEDLRFTPLRNPYKGLRAFGESDAADFYGREAAVTQLVEALAARRLVAAVGPSGVGKSSVVRAGLLPALRAGAIAGSDGWLIVDMLPGGYPLEELASALLRVAADRSSDLEGDLRRDERGLVRAAKRHLPEGAPLLLVVDQFEELFTLTASDEERTAFLDLLRCAATDERSDIRVVVTIRADHFDRPLRFSGFGDLLRQSTVPIAAPTEDELRAMVQRPAEGVGVQVVSGLVDRIVADVKDQPGALPLLEFTLTEMFDWRRSDRLTVENYQASHGVLGALGRRSEEIFGALSAADQAAARQVFVRLANVAESGRVTRRRLRRSALERLDLGAGNVGAVLAAFGEHRLLTFDRDPTTRGPTVEVAHEAILQEWPRLAGWIEELREDLLLHGRLAAAVADWEAAGLSEAFLLTGGRLSQHEAWAGDTELSLTETERDFLMQSRRADHEQRSRRRRLRRSILAGFGVAAVVASILAVFAFAQRAESGRRELLAQALALTQSARTQIGSDPERAALMAIEALEIYRDAGSDGREAVDVLRAALMVHRIVARYEGSTGSLSDRSSVAVDPTGTLFVGDEQLDGGVAVRRIDNGKVVRTLVPDQPMDQASGSAFSPDTSEVAVGFEAPDDSGGILVFDLETGAGRELVTLDAPPFDLAWGGEYLAAMRFLPGGEGERERWVFEVWDGSGITRWVEESTDGMTFAMDAATDLVALGLDDGIIEVRSLQSGDITYTHESPFPPFSMSLSPSGDRIAIVNSTESAVAVIDAASGTEEFRASTDRPFDVTWSDDGTQLVVVGNSAVPEVFDVATRRSRLLLRGQQGLISTVASIPGTDRVLTGADSNGDMVLWDIGPGAAASLRALSPGTGEIRNASYVASGSEVVLFAARNEVGPAFIYGPEGNLIDQIPGVIDRDSGPSLVVGMSRYLTWVDEDGISRVVDLQSQEIVHSADLGWQVADVTADLSAILLVDSDTADGWEASRIVDRANRILGVYPTLETCRGVLSVDAALVGLWACSRSEWTFFDVSTREELTQMLYVGSGTRFMPDGHSILTVDATGLLRLSDLDALRAGASYEEAELWAVDAHDGFVTSLTINGDGSLAASAARGDGVVRVWDVANRRTDPIAEIPNPLVTGSPRAVIHPTLRHLLIVTDDAVVHELTFDTDELLEIARQRLMRSLTELECERYLRRDDCSEFAEAS
ncbi:MAG TPA: protein kinase, partial [Acidimicrobiia bacterium]